MTAATSLAPVSLTEDVDAGGVALRIRPMRADDRRFIGPTWAFAYAKLAHVPADVFRREHRAVIDACLDAGTTLVLCSPEKEAALVGFACGEPAEAVLHAVYVAKPFRGMGLGARLIELVTGSPKGPVTTTHRFQTRGKPSRFVFNPYRARYFT